LGPMAWNGLSLSYF